ncbi:MAG: LamG-like jellyroll fold domain-containing protein [Salibacteraceae bacterium]
MSTNDELTVFVVLKQNTLTSNNSGVIHAAPSGDAFSTDASTKSVGMWVQNNGKLWGRGVQDNGSQQNLPKNTTISTGQFYYISQNYTGSQIQQFVNGSLAGTVNYDGSIRSWTDFGFGRQGNESMGGEIAEMIVFTTSLGEAEQIIVENYLAAKYGLSSSSNDYYTQDNSGPGHFDHHVAGIGKSSDGTSITTSRGSGIISMKSESNLSNGDYLFWGENQLNSDYSFSTSSADYFERLSSIWRVSTRNSPGLVSVSVLASELDLSAMSSCAELKLGVSNSSNFQSKTTYSLTLVDGEYVANNVSFNNGDYFSFEYQDVVAIDQNGFHNGSGFSKEPNTFDECYKLLVTSNANGNFNITTNAHVREVEVEAGGVITIGADKYLVVNGNIVNNGTINIAEHGSLTQNSTGVNANSGSGTYSITRSGNSSANNYNIWSSPIQDAPLTGVFSGTNPCDIWTFEESSQTWKYDFTAGYSTSCNGNSVSFLATDVIAGGDGDMNATRGYFIPGASSASRVYNGEVNNGDYFTPIKTTNLGNPGTTNWRDDDWNLLGNPYPSALSADDFWQENAIDNPRITDALYFWDEASSSGGYNQDSDYASWNESGGVASGNSNNRPLGNIASGQGFWVVANQSTNVMFKNSMRANTNNQFFKAQPFDKHNAWFSFSSPANHINKILVGYNDIATDGIDERYDAHKLIGNSPVRFASLIDGDEFSIQSLSNIPLNSQKVIPLVAFTSENGIHTFSNYDREYIPNGFKIYIRDKYLGIDFDLGAGDYEVDLVANTTYSNRFELVYKNLAEKAIGPGAVKDGVLTKPNLTSQISGIEEETQSQFKLTYSENGYSITNHHGINGLVKVMDVTGKIIWTNQAINTTSVLINLNNHTTGIYFIEVTSNGERVYQNKIMRQ